MSKIIYVTSPEMCQIHVFKINSNGHLNLLQVLNTKYEGNTIVLHPLKNYFYLGIKNNCGIINYKINKNGSLKEICITKLPGSPTFLFIDSFGKYLYIVSYDKGNLSLSNINSQFIIEKPKQIINGLTGCHSINFDFINNKIWIPCLKKHLIKIFNIANNGILSCLKNKNIYFEYNDGPRHISFNKNKKYAYVINELSGTVSTIYINIKKKNPFILNKINIINNKYIYYAWSSDIHITPNGKWLYCCDRNLNIVSVFSVSKKGNIIYYIGFIKTAIQPRSLIIDQNGKFIIISGQKSNNIFIYKINNTSGYLYKLNRYKVGLGTTWLSIKKMNKK
ncbi:MAG: beta-propeller fold lactonase family protein [Candidatus Makana argininalis]